MNKKISFLIILLICQIFIITYAYWPTDNITPDSTAFFPDLDQEDIQSLEITDEENSTISLDKNNGNWTINKDGFPADPATVKAVLTKIISLQSDRLVTQTKSSQARLSVAEEIFNRKITLQLKNGESKTFYLGTSPNSKTIHFRKATENQVFLVKNISSWELQTDDKSWWKTDYTKFNQEDLDHLKISNQHGVLSLKKEPERGWIIEDGSVMPAESAKEELNALADSLSTISLSDYLGPEKPAGLPEPIAQIDFQTKNAMVNLMIWPSDGEDDDLIAKASDSNYYVKIKTYMLKNALAAKIADFEVVEPIVPESSEDSSQL